MARARDELDAEAFQDVVGIAERLDFQLAAVARAGIDLPDGQCLAQDVEELAVNALDLRARRLAALGRRLGADAGARNLPEDLPHQRSCPEYARLNDLLMSGKSGTMLSITACSITGQFCHDGSWQWQRAMAPLASSSSATRTSPRQPSIQPAPAAAPAGGASSARTGPRGSVAQMARISRSDSRVSSKRTVTLAATSPFLCVAMRTSRASYGGHDGLQRRSTACALERPASPASPSALARSGATFPALMNRSCKP